MCSPRPCSELPGGAAQPDTSPGQTSSNHLPQAPGGFTTAPPGSVPRLTALPPGHPPHHPPPAGVRAGSEASPQVDPRPQGEFQVSLRLKEEKVPPGTSGPHVSTRPMPPGQPVPWAPATWGGSGWDQEGLRGEQRARWGWRGQGAAQCGGQVPGERGRMARLCLEPGPGGRARRELPERPCGASPQGSAGKGSVTSRGHAGEEPGRKGQSTAAPSGRVMQDSRKARPRPRRNLSTPPRQKLRSGLTLAAGPPRETPPAPWPQAGCRSPPPTLL